MRKFTFKALGLAMAAMIAGSAFTACSQSDNPTPPTPTPTGKCSKIVCISVPFSQSAEEYYAAEHVGQDTIWRWYGSSGNQDTIWIHNFDTLSVDKFDTMYMDKQDTIWYCVRTYPTTETAETYLAFSNMLKGYASDPQVKAVIFTQAMEQVVSAFRAFMQEAGRNDILVAGGEPDKPEVSMLCDVLLGIDDEDCGEQVAEQAKKWGCDILVHYSFPRHMAAGTVQQKHDAMKAKAEELNVTFVDRECQDYTQSGNIINARTALQEDIANFMKENEGKKVCFYCTNCGLQVALQRAILDEPRAYFALPCCPSPFHGFQEAFGLTCYYNNIDKSLKKIAAYLQDHNALDRFSTWRKPVNMAAVYALFDYSKAYVSNTIGSKVDMDFLKMCYSVSLGRDVVPAPKNDGSGNYYPNYLVNTPDKPVNFADYLK